MSQIRGFHGSAESVLSRLETQVHRDSTAAWLAMREVWKKTIRTGWGERRKGERKSKPCLPTTMVHSVRSAKLILEVVSGASFTGSPGGHQDHQPPVSHPTHHQSQLAMSPSEMIPGTVTRMTHDCSDLPPLCPGKALDEPGTHNCR